MYANAPDNTKYRLDNHCIALNSHKTCHLLDGCQARKPHTQKLVFQRRYTYLPGEDILIWQVSNTWQVCTDKWQSMCTSLAKYPFFSLYLLFLTGTNEVQMFIIITQR